MRLQHAAQESALRSVASARDAVDKAHIRREEVVKRQDAAVAEVERGQDEALAVLAELVEVGLAAQYAGETVKRVKDAQQRAAADVVAARVAELTDGLPVRRGPGRPRRSSSDVGMPAVLGPDVASGLGPASEV
jgi:hypothetical protein